MPRVLIAHDVSSTMHGYQHCEGAYWLYEQAVSKYGFIWVDNEKRDGEATHRGLMMACDSMDHEAIDAIQRSYGNTCVG